MQYVGVLYQIDDMMNKSQKSVAIFQKSFRRKERNEKFMSCTIHIDCHAVGLDVDVTAEAFHWKWIHSCIEAWKTIF